MERRMIFVAFVYLILVIVAVYIFIELQKNELDKTESCENGMRDGGESGVDCGGKCRGCVDYEEIAFSPPDLKAFPEAEGYAAYAKGGRGDGIQNITICEVNTTEDYLSDYNSGLGKYQDSETPINGSLRYCLQEVRGPRFVIFSTGGTISLKSELIIAPGPTTNHPEYSDNDYITIAGQTAPGEGIQLTRYGFWIINSNDIIVRYIRSRPGFYDSADDSANSLGVLYNSKNIMIDHNSLEWARDQDGSAYGNFTNVTFQWNIFGEGLTYGKWDPNYLGWNTSCGASHSHGILVSLSAANQTPSGFDLHHNFFIHNDLRNPMISSISGKMNVINNVVYNFGTMANYMITNYGTEYEIESIDANFVSNYFKPGPDTSAIADAFYDYGSSNSAPPNNSIYVIDNLGRYRNDSSQNESFIFFRNDNGWEPDSSVYRSSSWGTSGAPITIHTSEEASIIVPENAGAILPIRDATDVRLLNEYKTGTGDIGYGNCTVPASPPQSVYPILDAGVAPSDSDNDGIPDAWEEIYGINPSGFDSLDDKDGDGYLNIEEWINNVNLSATCSDGVQNGGETGLDCGGGCGSCGGDGGNNGGNNNGGGSGSYRPRTLEDCETDWTCSDWGECDEDGLMRRVCTDSAGCNITFGRPVEVEACEVDNSVYLNNQESGDVEGGGIFSQLKNNLGKITVMLIAYILILALLIVLFIRKNKLPNEIGKN